jgi:hypothetical protein
MALLFNSLFLSNRATRYAEAQLVCAVVRHSETRLLQMNDRVMDPRATARRPPLQTSICSATRMRRLPQCRDGGRAFKLAKP